MSHSCLHFTSSSQLIHIFGNDINLKAALCVTCSDVNLHVEKVYDEDFPWCLSLHCRTCSCSYSICKKCPQIRSKFTKRFLLNRHHKSHHSSDVLLDDGGDVLSDVPQVCTDTAMLQSSSNDINGESYEVAPLEEASRYSDVWYGMTYVTDDTIHDLQGESYDVASLEQATNYSGL
jgi:hypothetical protein